MLNILKIRKINLLTNNPDKIRSIENSDIILNSRIPLEMDSNEVNESYLAKKKKYFGHLLEKI
jgi:GTP cyclohydrolase II